MRPEAQAIMAGPGSTIGANAPMTTSSLDFELERNRAARPDFVLDAP
jgi:hypothetical protein